jgi:hypothetical protein
MGAVNRDNSFYGTTFGISDAEIFHLADYSEICIVGIGKISRFDGKFSWKVTKMG